MKKIISTTKAINLINDKTLLLLSINFCRRSGVPLDRIAILIFLSSQHQIPLRYIYFLDFPLAVLHFSFFATVLIILFNFFFLQKTKLFFILHQLLPPS